MAGLSRCCIDARCVLDRNRAVGASGLQLCLRCDIVITTSARDIVDASLPTEYRLLR